MRWLVIHPGPRWSVADVYNGWVEALRDLGEEVEVYNLDDRIAFFDSCLVETGEMNDEGYPQVRKALSGSECLHMAAEPVWAVAYRWWPDVILGISAFFTPPFMLDVLRSRRHKIVLLHTESPYQDSEQLERAAHADLNLVNDPVNLDRYRQLGVPARYQPHCYRPKVHYPGSGRKQWDLAFAGTGFPSRHEFFSAMNLTGLRVALAGGWVLEDGSPLRNWVLSPEAEGAVEPMNWLDNAATADLYRAARAGINFYRRESGRIAPDGTPLGNDVDTEAGVAMGPREVEMAACGLWFTRDPRPESDETFPLLPSFTSPAEASEQIRWAVAHPRERGRAAEAARNAVEGRTFEAAACTLIREVSAL